MPVDRLPWTYHGQPESGGRLSPREQPSDRHPTHRGRLYVVGHGWLWLAGWAQADGSIRLAADPMTEAQVDQYCLPRGSGRDDRHANQAPVSAPRAALFDAATRAELIGPHHAARRAPPAPAPAARARTPPGGPSGPAAGVPFSHRPPLSQETETVAEPKTVRRADVARGGRRQLSKTPDAETTAAAMEELNDDIPF